VGGSGKQSLTRFASFVAGFKCFSIELSRGYGLSEFRDDLKNLYQQTGVDGVPTVFLFTDTQIVSESFVEDINNILNSGEVPALFDQTEKDRMCSDIREYAETLGVRCGASPITAFRLCDCPYSSCEGIITTRRAHSLGLLP
jgi:dynein heavy chain